MEKMLTVRNRAQQILFEQELMGQISDGMWENARPHDHWKPWSGAVVAVGGSVGRNFYAQKDNYNFTNPKLLEIVGERMLAAVQVENPWYSWKDMLGDLRDLKVIIIKTAVA